MLDKRHLKTSGGAIVRDEDGTPLTDDGPELAAIDRLLRIGERRAKLLELDAPVQGAGNVTAQYELVGVDPEQLA